MPPENEQDYGGYSSLEELLKGYRSSGEEAKRLKTRAEQLELQNQRYETAFREREGSTATQRLTDFGVPTDAVESLIDQRIARALEPLARGASARNTLLSQYPDYQKYEADVARYIEQNESLSRTYKNMFTTDPVGAMEYAFLKYGETQRKTVQNGSGGERNPQAQARSEARIPSERNGDSRNGAGSGSAGDELVRQSWEHYQKSGDPRFFAKARLRQVLSEGFIEGH